MKLLILFIVALVIASGLAYQVHIDPGYALLRYGTWSVETSLAVMVFILLVAFVVLAMLFKALLGIKRTPKRLQKWNKHRVQRRSIKELNQGLLNSAEGNWKRSEKLLTKHAKQSETPLLNYLSAAHAAQAQGAYDRRDEYLLKAGDALPEQAHAIHLTRAKLQFSAGQFEQALATLQQLLSVTPNHPIVLSLLLKTLSQLNDWEAIHKLLPIVKSNRNIQADEWEAVEIQTLTKLLTSKSQNNDPELDTLWHSLSKKQKLSANYLSIYAGHKIAKKDEKDVSDLIVKSIKTTQDESLIDLYCQLDISPDLQIKQLEKWLNILPSSTILLNHIARLSLSEKQWGKTSSFLQQSINIKPTSLAYLLQGRLHEEQGETPEKAAEFYRAGIEIANNLLTTELVAVADNTKQAN
ncbi:MAG: heme biosynthesis protein HemY [Piscirickettsiaceae bacterium]|nr:MAG: heme biosynthesis protein HemY [Piscirickettsiaceae bacterium]